MSAIAEPPETTQAATTPPGERQAINSMADKFKAAMATVKPAAIAPTTPPQKPQEPPKPAEPAKTTPAPEKPAVAPPEKPAAPPATPVKPAEEENLSRKNYKALEESRDKYKAEVEALKAAATERDQLKAELENARKGSAEYEEAKKKLAEQEQFLKQFAIEHSPEFQAHYGQRLQSAVLEAKEAVGTEHAAQIETALQIPPSAYRDQQVAALAEGLGEWQKLELMRAYTDLKRTERERAAELKKSSENLPKLQELQNKRAQEEQAKALEQQTNFVNKMMANEIEPELEGVEAATAQTIRDNARKMALGQIGAEEYAKMLRYSVKGQKYETTVKEQAEKITKLEAQLAELQGAQPSLSSSPSQQLKKAPQRPEDFEPIGQVFRRARDGK